MNNKRNRFVWSVWLSVLRPNRIAAMCHLVIGCLYVVDNVVDALEENVVLSENKRALFGCLVVWSIS